MVPFGRELVSSHSLSIQTTLVFGIVWPQFAMQVLTGVANPQFGGKGGRMGSEMGPLSSPDTTSCRLPHSNYRSISRRFRNASDVPDRQTDGRN